MSEHSTITLVPRSPPATQPTFTTHPAPLPACSPVLISLCPARSVWVRALTTHGGVRGPDGVRTYTAQWHGPHGRRVLSGFCVEAGNIRANEEGAEEGLWGEGQVVLQ